VPDGDYRVGWAAHKAIAKTEVASCGGYDAIGVGRWSDDVRVGVSLAGRDCLVPHNFGPGGYKVSVPGDSRSSDFLRESLSAAERYCDDEDRDESLHSIVPTRRSIPWVSPPNFSLPLPQPISAFTLTLQTPWRMRSKGPLAKWAREPGVLVQPGNAEQSLTISADVARGHERRFWQKLGGDPPRCHFSRGSNVLDNLARRLIAGRSYTPCRGYWGPSIYVLGSFTSLLQGPAPRRLLSQSCRI